MKNQILFAVVIAGLLLASCGITRNHDFSSRKYTKFHKGESRITETVIQVTTEKTKLVVLTNESSSLKKQTSTSEKSTAAVIPTEKNHNVAIVADNTFKSSVETESPSAKKEVKKIKGISKYLLSRITDKPNTTSENSDASPVVLLILAILLPPLAVFLAKGICTDFWIDLLLAVLVVLYPVAIIYALIVIFG